MGEMLRKYFGYVGRRMKPGAITIVFLFLFSCSAVFGGEYSPRVLTVAFPESRGLNETYADGSHGGIVYDWLMEIAKYTGWRYEFVSDDATSLLNGMMDGQYDLMGGMYYQEDLEEYFEYTKYIMGTSYSWLIYRRDDQSIRDFDLTTLNGKTIGVYSRATGKLRRLQNFLDFNNLACEIKLYDDVLAYEHCLDQGDADLMLSSDVFMTEDYNVAAKFDSDPYYFVTKKGETELCETLDWAIGEIYSADPDFARKLYARHSQTDFSNSLVFSDDELAFIGKADSIRVAISKNRYPLSYEQNGVFYGIVPDLLKHISQKTGLAFTYVCADTYQGLLDLVHSGKADFLSYCFHGDQFDLNQDFACTAPYIELDNVVVKNKLAEFSDSKLTIAVMEGTAVPRDGLHDSVLYFPDYRGCLHAVDTGNADYMLIPAAFISELYNEDYYPHITIVEAPEKNIGISIALPTPVNVPLYSILNKVVNNLSSDELETIRFQNPIPPNAGTVNMKSLLYTYPIAVISLCLSVLLIIGLCIALIWHSKMKNQLLQLKLGKSEEMAKIKQSFFSRMSHEIRTPMNAIIGLTNYMLLQGDLTPEVQKNLEKIASSSTFLLSLVNDVLDMSKIEDGRMTLVPVSFSLTKLVEQLNDMFAAQGEDKGLHFSVRCEVSDTYVVGDDIRLRQVLVNLLSNACKFTESPGRILCLIRQEGVTQDRIGRYHFSVQDDGIGISQENLSCIFNSFEQVSTSGHREQGTGLGLSISANLVKLMGGELQVHSEIGRGSEFFFDISLPVSDASNLRVSSVKEVISLEGLHVLLVEDNTINAEIAKSLLELKQVSVDWAHDGKEGVEMFGSHPEYTYDAILMDIQMPVMDGLEAAKAIRALPRKDASSICIIAMSANSFQEDIDQAMAVGMDRYLTKPFEVEQLYSVLEHLARQ